MAYTFSNKCQKSL